MNEETDLQDLRQSERFIAQPPIPGSFGSVEILISNLSEAGVQAEHTRPMKLGMAGRLSFSAGPRVVALPARVVWSRLSEKPDASGKPVYRSGFQLENGNARDVLESLLKVSRVIRDTLSLQRKKERLAEKARALASQPRVKPLVVQSAVSADVMLLVQQARERLQTHPDEATKWYNRARYTIAEIGAQSFQHREDVVAIWEALERTIDLETIAQALAQMKK